MNPFQYIHIPINKPHISIISEIIFFVFFNPLFLTFLPLDPREASNCITICPH